jgi:glycosyltransferase involved in cell wall biosynthesis
VNVLFLHNAYQQAGGEDAVVRNEAELLGRAGHSVVMEVVHNDRIVTVDDKMRTLWRARYDPSRVAWMDDLLRRVRPDVVHVHNFFPLLTTAVHQTAHRRGVPVVQTLHNYRLFCAAATFERQGSVCELCLHGSRHNAVLHRCYRGSLPGTAAVVAMQREAIERRRLVDNVDRFIALTEFARGKFIEGGLSYEKLVVKPNFLDRPARPPADPRAGALFVGRLSLEKGVDRLVAAWRNLPDVALTIAGDGPLRGQLQQSAPANVRFLGRINSHDVEAEMRRSAALIVPSTCYEGFPMTIAEAFANGLPVIASRIGSLAELVEPGVTGDLCVPGDEADIAATVARTFADPAELVRMSCNARRTFEERYTAKSNLAMLESIYRDARQAGSVGS